MTDDDKERKFNAYDIELATWRGQVTQSLKSIKYELMQIVKNLEIMNSRITKNQVKIAGIAAAVAILITITFNIFIKFVL